MPSTSSFTRSKSPCSARMSARVAARCGGADATKQGVHRARWIAVKDIEPRLPGSDHPGVGCVPRPTTNASTTAAGIRQLPRTLSARSGATASFASIKQRKPSRRGGQGRGRRCQRMHHRQGRGHRPRATCPQRSRPRPTPTRRTVRESDRWYLPRCIGNFKDYRSASRSLSISVLPNNSNPNRARFTRYSPYQFHCSQHALHKPWRQALAAGRGDIGNSSGFSAPR